MPPTTSKFVTVFLSLCLLAGHKKLIKQTNLIPHNKEKTQQQKTQKPPQIRRLILLRKKKL